MTLSLFFFVTGNLLACFYFVKNKIIWKQQTKLMNNFVEIFFTIVSQASTRHQLPLAKISKIYTGIGPGSFITNRAIVLFLKTLLILNPQIQIFTINNLLFQAGLDVNTISILSFSRHKVCVQKFHQRQILAPAQLLFRTALPSFLAKYPHFLVCTDFTQINL